MSAPKLVRTTIIVDVGSNEQQLVNAWRKRWKGKVYLKNKGCQCCIDMWVGKGPREAFMELPSSLFAYGEGPDDKPNT